MDTYPRMLYRQPGPEPMHGGLFATLIVQSAEEETAAAAQGWHLTTTEAAEALAAKGSDDDTAPPTRAELEAKATELGIEFSARIGDKKLGERIAEALAAKG